MILKHLLYFLVEIKDFVSCLPQIKVHKNKDVILMTLHQYTGSTYLAISLTVRDQFLFSRLWFSSLFLSFETKSDKSTMSVICDDIELSYTKGHTSNQ